MKFKDVMFIVWVTLSFSAAVTKNYAVLLFIIIGQLLIIKDDVRKRG